MKVSVLHLVVTKSTSSSKLHLVCRLINTGIKTMHGIISLTMTSKGNCRHIYTFVCFCFLKLVM